jgi:nucleoid DNA-binding protein
MSRKLGGRAYLVAELVKHGASRRRAVRFVNIVFGEMRRALQRGERVEFPFGYLERVRHRHRKQRGWFLRRITTIYKKRYTIEHRVDAVGQYILDKMAPEEQGRLGRPPRPQPASLSPSGEPKTGQ